ncbi:uncharacterized protein At1g15400-like [Henckelia pumila]|uniref:uncharacterized protein At1g15400-like n=1 Tax=Henckelia pumila TaxID=405737 RepID=UPI003C6E1AEC
MTGLQRSGTSFRRQGSSGLVWDDQKYFSGELQKIAKIQNSQHDQDVKSVVVICVNTHNTYRVTTTIKEVPAISEPPSPRLSGCGLCPIFERAKLHSNKQRKSNKF